MDLDALWREQQAARMPEPLLTLRAGGAPLAALDARIAAILTPCLRTPGALRIPEAARRAELGGHLQVLAVALAGDLDPASRAYLERLGRVGEAVYRAVSETEDSR